MHSLAAAGTAAQRSYTCLQCLRRLSGVPNQATVNRHAVWSIFRSYATAITPTPAPTPTPTPAPTPTPIVKRRGRRGAAAARRKSIKGDEVQKTKSGVDENGSVQSEKATEASGTDVSDAGEGLVRKIVAKAKRTSSKPASISIKSEPRGKGDKSSKSSPGIGFIVKNHQRLSSDLKSIQKRQRGRKNAPSLPVYRSILQDQLKLSNRIAHLETTIGGAMENKYPEGSKDFRFLSSISKSLTTMAKKLETMVSEAEGSSGSTPTKREQLSGEQQLRQSQALRQIISASEASELFGDKEDDANDVTDSASAIKSLLTLLPSPGGITSISATTRKKIYECFSVLVPNVSKTDYAGLARLVAQHVSEKAKAKEERASDKKGVSRTQTESLTIEEALRSSKKTKPKSKPEEPRFQSQVSSQDLSLEPIHVEQPPVRGLAYGLDRVLFNPGVYLLQDPRSKLYNFDPYLQNVMPVQDFNFDLLQGFITSSEDTTLQNIAKENTKKYTGSSSSMTGVLSQFHYLLSRNRAICHDMMSRAFSVGDHHAQFTTITRVPASIFLRWKEEQGIYAIDSDKQYDETNVLSLLGNSLERLLTLPTSQYEKYRSGSQEQLTEAEQNAPETYHYTGFGDILMRSQLDAHDPRLPGTGMFDLKTRAVLPVRMHVQEYLNNRDYEIRMPFGNFESFEREWMDMMRATMIKYMLQVRIGRMDGIFIAYHNTQRIFGFQYAPLEELDLALHGQRDKSLGDEEFKLSVKLMNEVLNKATERFPKQTLRIHAHTSGGGKSQKMQIFVEPFSEEEADKLQSKNKERNEKVMQEIMAGLAPRYDKDNKRIFPEQQESVSEADEVDDAKSVTEVAAELQSSAEVDSENGFHEHEEDPKNMTLKDEFLEDTGLALERQLEQAGEQSAGLEDASSSADPNFLDGIDGDVASMAAESEAPLMALELQIDNFVNGKPVLRPGFGSEASQKRFEEVSEAFSVAKGDKWEVFYELKEITDRNTAWQMYLALKKKRKNLVDNERDRGGDLAFIMRTLKTYVESGRRYRAKKDREDLLNPTKTVLGDSRPRSSSAGVVGTTSI